MRILHVVTDMRTANGIMSVILNYFREMPPGTAFDAVYFKEFPDNRENDWKMLGGRTVRLSRPGVKSFFYSDWDEFFREHAYEYEAVHIHAPHLACLIAPKARKYGIKKILVHCHSTCYSLHAKNAVRNRILAFPAKHMNAKRIACGKKAGEFWYGKNNFEVLPNAIDCESFRFDERKREQKRREMGLTDSFVIGHIGIATLPVKNQIFLIPILKEVLKTRDDCVLLLVGAEPEENIVKRAEEMGVGDRVLFLGSRRDVNELLFAMDVFVFPSLNEGLPISVLEAQAASLPVVMSDSITDEVCCTENTVKCSLKEQPKEWARIILEAANRKRRDTCDDVKRCGWDIRDAAKRLEEIYKA